MSLLQNSNAISAGGYDINNSLRFRSSASASLTRTPASSGNQQKFTWSGWVKRGTLSSGTQVLFMGGNTLNDYTVCLAFNSNDTLTVRGYTAANATTTAVYRDPAAWYHIVVAIDTTQTTSTNRIKLYVNNILVASGSIDLNWSYLVNTTVAHAIGNQSVGWGFNPFDGYMTDINFVDGQALTPSSFGETDPVTGSWVAKKYTGTYGTNGYYLPFTQNTNTAYAVYTTDLSANYHSLPTGSQGTNFTFSGDFTIEGWVLYPSSITDHSFYVSNSGSIYFALNIDISTGLYNIYCNSSTPTSSFASGITAGNWTHVAMVRSGSTITLYTNGVARGTITNSSTLGFSSLTLNRFGGGAAGARYMSNVRITKSAIYTAKFVPPTTALTNVANTVVLTYQNATAIDNSSNGYTLTATGSPSLISGGIIWNANIISDVSGNSNHWTPNNLNYSLYGVTYDAMTDVPTNTSATVANYATLNPLAVSASTGTCSNGNLTSTGINAGGGNSFATIALPTSGKFYWEATPTTITGDSMIGLSTVSTASSYFWQNTDGSIAYYNGNGNKYINNSATAYGATYTTNDVIGVAVDLDAGTVTFYKNNTSQGAITFNASGLFPAVSDASGSGASVLQVNFGQRPFTYTPPTGYKALNTFNLPDSTIKKGNMYMDATLYTGNGTTQTITNAASFKPDLVWGKTRSIGYSNILYDSVRGVGTSKMLLSDTTGAEGSVPTNANLTSFNSNGFSVGATSSTNVLNGTGDTMVGWQWQAGQGTTSTNTAGSVTSTVSVNATAGFSICTFNAGASGNQSFGHGLGVAPKMVIVKDRINSVGWNVYHSSVITATNQFLQLNVSNAPQVLTGIWGSTLPTSTLVGFGSGVNVVANNNCVAYCWAEINGFSKFGIYAGNGSADGPFVYTGFRPKFIIMKNATTTGQWLIKDTSRNPFNIATANLYSNLPNLEDVTATAYIDILSNGFKLRGTYADINGSTNGIIYAAFAENPFKNSNAR